MLVVNRKEPVRMAMRRTKGMTIRQWTGAVAFASVAFGVIAWLGRLFDGARRSARAADCSGHLCQITLALHNDRAANGCFPPAYITDSQGVRTEDGLPIRPTNRAPNPGRTSRG
jgi:hypothetical protein